VTVVHGDATVEQVEHADPMRQGDFLIVAGGTVTLCSSMDLG
jgi:hypothetical protein